MVRRARVRHIVALALGAAAMGLGVLALDVQPLVSAVVGVLVYGGTLLLTMPGNSFKSLTRRKDLGYAPEFVIAELQQARDRIQSIRKIRSRIQMFTIAESIGAIADSADAMVADLTRDPGDYRRLRKALAHYLPHVEIIAERYADLMEAGSMNADIRGRAEQTLADMQRLFVEYQRRMMADDTFDLDARISLLEQEVKREGVARSETGASRSTSG